MSLLKAIMEAQGGDALKQLASKFNLNPEQAGSAVTQLLPALTGGLKQNMSTPDGLGSLLNALKKGNHQRYIDNPAELTRSEAIDDGNGILGHLLGSKEVSRKVAADAAERTGIDVGILKKMLPMVAAMTMGGMSKQVQAQETTGALGNLASKLGDAQAQAGGILGKFLDADNDGSVMDDVMGFAKKLMR